MNDDKLSNETEVYISSIISKMELKNARETSNLTQSQVAEISKLSINCISDIENDKGNPTFKSIQRYLNAIGYEIMFRKKSI